MLGAAVGTSVNRLYFSLRSSHPPSNTPLPSFSFLNFLQAGSILLIPLTPPCFLSCWKYIFIMAHTGWGHWITVYAPLIRPFCVDFLIGDLQKADLYELTTTLDPTPLLLLYLARPPPMPLYPCPHNSIIWFPPFPSLVYFSSVFMIYMSSICTLSLFDSQAVSRSSISCFLHSDHRMSICFPLSWYYPRHFSKMLESNVYFIYFHQ